VNVAGALALVYAGRMRPPCELAPPLAALLTCWAIGVSPVRAQAGSAPAPADPELPTNEAAKAAIAGEMPVAAPVQEPIVPEQSPAPVATRELRKQKLQAELSKLQRESAHRSLLLPWTALSISAAAIATGLVLGLSHGLGCERSCTTSAWPGWLVLVGTTTGTASLVWLELEERSDAELQSRRLGLERELERIHWDEMPRPPQAALHWSGTF